MITRTHFDLFGGGGGDLAHDDSVILLEGDLVLRLSNVSATHHIADDLSSHAPIIPIYDLLQMVFCYILEHHKIQHQINEKHLL